MMHCICYTPISTQATNRRELIFIDSGGIREVSLLFFFYNRDVLRVSPDSDTISSRIFGEIGSIGLEIAQEFITISKITLDHAARKLKGTY